MSKYIPTILLAIFGVAMTVLYVGKAGEVEDLEEELAEQTAIAEGIAKTQVRVLKEEGGTLNSDLLTEINRLNRRILELEEAVSRVGRRAPATPSGSQGFSSLAELMESPSGRQMMRQHQRAQIELLFGDFLQNANLTDEQRKQLEDLLLDRQMLRVKYGLAMMRDGATDEDRAEARRQLQLETEQLEGEMKALLGEELYNTLNL